MAIGHTVLTCVPALVAFLREDAIAVGFLDADGVEYVII